MSVKKTTIPVAIFREKLLPYSETFIANQVASLERYDPEFVSFERTSKALELPASASVLLEQPGMKNFDVHALKLMGHVPKKWCAHLEAKQFKLMHAHFGPDALWALPLAQQLGIPLVATFHGYDLVPTQKPLGRMYHYYRWRRKAVFRQAKKVLAVSNFIKLKLIEAGCPSEKIVTHYIGIDLKNFQPEVVEREPIILYVGRLIEQKGALDLLHAMPAVLHEHPGVRVVVIGSGVMEAQISAEARRLGVPCEFLGVQPPKQVRFWMNKAALLCVPARNEAFGIVYAEAQAMHLPVVAYAHSGVPEAVRNGIGGLLTRAGDLSQLSVSILTLLNNPKQREQMGRSGRVDVEKRLDLHKQTRVLEEIYDHVSKK